MKLFFRETGQGEPLIILHGLYGSSDNWMSIAKELGEYYKVYAVDQRNHGQSPHDPTLNYNVLTSDLIEFFLDLNIEKAVVIGHSMGGKVAMQFALDHPEKVKSLIVVDIAPWSHLSGNELSSQLVQEHRHIISGLMSIPIKMISSRFEADVILSQWVKYTDVRQFLLKNMKRENDGSFSWKFNLPVIASNLSILVGAIDPDNEKVQSNIQTLFIKGGKSNYIPDEREEEIKGKFPNSQLVNIKNAGHWVHAEKPKEFVEEVLRFLNHLD